MNKGIVVASLALVFIVMGLGIGTVFASTNQAGLSPTSGSLAPNSSGSVTWSFSSGVLSGKFEVRNLPAQGSTQAYGAWFVNTATEDKAFLGALVQAGEHTILFQTSGSGKLTFSAAAFTSGPNAGSPITLASTGQNLFIILVETNIDFMNPAPIGSAVSATF
ncbi:MAG: hypothetical protein HYW93_02525 [Thaumarchaeota archaeon]|nr:hypothetical protein [Nitrososphaerota archaeon]